MDINIFDFLQSPKKHSYGIIKLNSEFSNERDLKLFIRLWEQAKIRGSADGASNVLHSSVKCSKTTCLPTFISGDFDSIMPNIKSFYASKGVEIIPTPDQDETDFTKCLKILHNKAEASNIQLDFIVAHVGASLSRFDHMMANINTMVKYAHQSNVFLFIIMGDSVSFILKQGTTTIHANSPLRGAWCSLVPIGGPCRSISTRGLLYNMTGATMEFGGLVSTSNGFEESALVVVTNSDDILWSVGLNL